jgi:hypothetical protein
VNSLMAFFAGAALPNAIFDEQRRDFVRVMIFIGYRVLARFQLLDCLNVLKPRQAFFELRHVHCEHSFSGCYPFLGPSSGENIFHFSV